MAERVRAEDIETSQRIFLDLMTLRDDPSLSDVLVVVGESEFPCHRALLAAVSGFFRGAFTTDMREARQGRISLNDIDKDVFSIILTCIYNGKCVLTEENLFQIWPVADQPQITFLISQCLCLWEKVLDTSLATENCLRYLGKIRPFGEKAKCRVLEFIGNNFLACGLHIVSNLQQIEKDEMQFLVANDKLNVESEDSLIGNVLVWAENRYKTVFPGSTEDESSATSSRDEGEDSLISSSGTRAQHLADVLECTRYLLISWSYLHVNLARHSLVRTEPRCEALLEKATEYQAQPHLHQTWCPTAAIHREKSPMANTMLMCELNRGCRLTILDMASREWKHVTLPKLDHWQSDAKLFCYNSKIVVFSGGNKMSTYSPVKSTWLSLDLLYRDSHINAICDEYYFYKFDKAKGELRITTVVNSSHIFDVDQLRYKCRTIAKRGDLQGLDIEHIASIGNSHVVFFGSRDVDAFTVVCFDPLRRYVRVYSDQLRSRSRLVTFGHGKDLFLLQEDGCLWRTRQGSKPDDINFTLEKTMWSGQVALNGAVLFGEQLLVVGEFPNQAQFSELLDISLPGVFQGVRKIKRCPRDESICCGISLAVLPKSMFV